MEQKNTRGNTRGGPKGGPRRGKPGQGKPGQGKPGNRQGGRPQVDPLDGWEPKTTLGKQVLAKEVTDIDKVLGEGRTILEPEIVDALVKNLESDLLLIGQAKGKFGGGQRRVFRNTQKKTREGNKPKFTVMAIVGDKNGHIGIGHGSSKETVPAREKAIRKAKLNLFKIRRGSGSWESVGVNEPHSIPFAVNGKCGSVIVQLMPAPKGKGLCVEKECAKVLDLAGIKDVWSKSQGQTKNKMNMIKALESALRKLSTTRIQPEHTEELSIVEGAKGA
jgi:small subunit ribosomal protein S5